VVATPGVLIIDAQERSAAAACRTLRAAGYRVGAACSSRPAPGQWSLACSKRYTLSNPRLGGRRYAEEAAAIAASDGYFTVMPGADASLLAVSRNRDVFGEGVDLSLPPVEVVETCVNKVDLIEAAAGVGLDVPETVVCETVADARAAGGELGFPLLLKPRSSVFEHGGAIRERASFLAPDADALESRLPEFGLPCLLQRREAGCAMSFAGVFAEGRLLGAVWSRYRRVWPQSAGSVSFSESVDVPRPLAERVEGFLTAMRWQGIFELELIERSPESYGAIDFNPRLYGSLALAARAGVPLPAIWCDWLSGHQGEVRTARAGFHYRWEDAELRNMIAHLRGHHLLAATSVIRPRRRCAHAFFAWNDPGPLLARALELRMRYSAIRKGSDGAGMRRDRLVGS